MRFVEKVGKNLEIATTDALIELGATRDEVEIEVIEKGSKGFFGIGAKNAKVRVTVKVVEEDYSFLDEPTVAPTVEEPEIKTEAKPVQKVKEKPKAKPKQNTVESPKAKQVEPKVETITETKTEEIKEKPVVNVDEAVHRAEEFLTKVLREMGIEPSFEVKVVDKRINMTITGNKMGLVIGKRGETLDSLQYLVNIVVNKGQEGYIKVMLDTENYRARREETLRKVALKFAKKATEAKRPVSLEPMNPYDRRIIHSVLQNSKTVKTHSEGREPFRKVVISPIGYGKNNKRQA